MKKPNLPYLDIIERKGVTYIYFRRGKVRHRLPDNPDTEEFSRAYWEIRSGKKTSSIKTTWGALVVSYYKSPEFNKLSDGTKANYRRHCEVIREKNGIKDVRRFRRKHAIAARDALQETWSKANERIAVLSILCKHAVDLEWIDRNPVVDISKLSGGSYEAWPDVKLLAFERYCLTNDLTTALTAFEVAIGTGQRIGDCAKMAWDDFDGEFMNVIQDKTKAKLRVYCPERLQQYLGSLPRKGRHIFAKNLTQPIGKRQIQKSVEDVRDAIGIMGGKDRLVPHGWRYTAAKLLAEAGCSDSEIQAVTGHKTLTMVQKYRAQADQETSSKRAQQRREKNKTVR